MPSNFPRTRALRRGLVAATVCAGVATALVATTGLAAAPASAPVAASAAAVFAAAPVAGFAAAPAAWGIDAITTSTADAQATLDRAEGALAAATSIQVEVAASGLDLGGADTSIDTAQLSDASDALAAAAFVPALIFPQLADDAASRADEVEARVASVRALLADAQARKAAEEAAAEAQRQAEAAAAAEAQRRADELAAANTPDGAKATAQRLAAERYGWGGDQFSCLVSLWQRESNWNYQAYNASSGATGIPQALPGSKMASAGSDWQTSAATQISWGLDYIDRAYGTPCSAWGHSNATGWY